MTNKIEYFENILKENCKVQIMPKHESDHYLGQGRYMGIYRADLDIIAISSDYRHFDVHYLATLFHELIHATGSPKRLNRLAIRDIMLYRSNPMIRACEEIIAELGASFLMSYFKLANDNTIKNHAEYINRYVKIIGQDKFDQIKSNIFTVTQDAVNYTLTNWFKPTPSQIESSQMEKLKEFNKFY